MTKFKVTIELELSVNGMPATGFFFSPKEVTKQIQWILGGWEDGHDHLAIETLQALTHSVAANAILQVVRGKLFDKHKNTLAADGKTTLTNQITDRVCNNMTSASTFIEEGLKVEVIKE